MAGSVGIARGGARRAAARGAGGALWNHYEVTSWCI
jgi:hypothetical protein